MITFVFRAVVFVCLLSAPVIIYRNIYPALTVLSGEQQTRTVDGTRRDPAYFNSVTKQPPSPRPSRKVGKTSIIPPILHDLPTWSFIQTVLYVFVLHMFLKRLYSDRSDGNRVVIRRDSQARLNLQKAYKKAARNHGAELKAVKQLLSLYRSVIHVENCPCKDAYIVGLLENNADGRDASIADTPIGLPESERNLLLKDVRKRNCKIFDQNSKLQFMERSMEVLRRELSHHLSAEVAQEHVPGDGRGNGKTCTQSSELEVLRAFQKRLDKYIEKSREWQVEDIEVYDGENDDPTPNDVEGMFVDSAA